MNVAMLPNSFAPSGLDAADAVVKKFGGTSLATIDLLRDAATRSQREHASGRRVVVVCSAMGGTTDQLLAMARRAGRSPSREALDLLLSTGEQTAGALMAMALRDLGVPVDLRSPHTLGLSARASGADRAIIEGVDGASWAQSLASGNVIVAPGFVATTCDGSVVTLGRGGSDTTAVAMAAALSQRGLTCRCEIDTDVAGVFTADPALVPAALKHEVISTEMMHALAAAGAKVISTDAIEIAHRAELPVYVRAAHRDEPGTWVVPGHSTVRREAHVGLVGCALAETDDPARLTLSIVGHGLDETPVRSRLAAAAKCCQLDPAEARVTPLTWAIGVSATAAAEVLNDLHDTLFGCPSARRDMLVEVKGDRSSRTDIKPSTQTAS